jgi:DNA repair protein RadC
MNTISEVQISYKPSREVFSDIIINRSTQASEIFQQIWSSDLEYKEEMNIILMNRANKILGYNRVSTGGTTGTVVDLKVLFQLILKTNTQAFVIAHNHPSGNLKPSVQDLKLTEKVKEISRLLDVSFLDHMILSEGSYYSMADEGDM